MLSIDFVNGSRVTDGVFRVNFQVYTAAASLGLDVHWIECIDPSISDSRYTGGETVRGRSFPVSEIEQGINRLWTFPHRLKRRASDRVFLGDPTFVRLSRGSMAARTIIRVNDLRPLTRYSDRSSARWMFRYAVPRLRQSRRIVVYTDYLRKQLSEIPGLRDRIYVLRPHIEVDRKEADHHLRAALDRRSRTEPLTVLYVATDRPYKNIRFFLELAKSLENDSEPRFHFLLLSHPGPSLEAALREVDPANVSLVALAPDIEEFYQQADILAFPSLYEGFGLPLLEAMSRGLPVIANDLEPMREIVGQGGALLPPGDHERWKAHIRSLADSRPYRDESMRAIKRAQEYSYSRFVAGVPGLFD